MKINFQALNECFGIDGPTWVEDNPDNYISLPNTYVFNSDWQRELARKNAIERNKKYKGGNNDGIAVPQMQVQYSTTGAGGQDPNSIIKQNTSVSVQAAENAKYDDLARKGGSRKKRGGNPDWSWGCYSGGRKSRSRRSKSYKRKQQKKRRTRRHK